MTIRHGERLLGHLVERRSEFLLQGEVFATIGLGWILQTPEASNRFGEMLGVGSLAWQANVEVLPGVWPDLIGQLARAELLERVCVVEAKIHHEFGEDQMVAYSDWLSCSETSVIAAREDAVLGLLVPVSRLDDANRFTDRLAERTKVHLTTISWEETFEALEAAGLPSEVRCDLRQLEDLYHQYDASWIPPFSAAELTDGNWSGRRADIEKLIDQVTARLQRSSIGREIPRVLPMPAWAPEGTFRFLDLELPKITSVAVGLFNELDGFPLAVRYRSQDIPDAGFADVRTRLEATGGAEVMTSGHVYVRLQVPHGVSQLSMLADLARQISEVITTGHPEIPRDADTRT